MVNDDLGTDFSDGDSGDGPGGETPLTMAVTGLEALCDMYKVSLAEVAAFLPGYLRFVETVEAPAPPPRSRAALVLVRTGGSGKH